MFERVSKILEDARQGVARAVNTAMVNAYWEIGRQLVEEEQQGSARADYGTFLVETISARLSARFGKGFGKQNLWRMRQFYACFPTGSTIQDPKTVAALRRQSIEGIVAAPGRQLALLAHFPSNLSWTHYRKLLAVSNEQARAFYELEAARSNWSTRELERQIASMLFERLAKSHDEAGVLAMARDGQQVAAPSDVVKDPFVLEFLDLEERTHWHEHDLEQAIIDRLGDFLLELGRGFCFVARQKRLTLDGDHFYVDLVFYNRLLRCFVLIDLKLGKLTHQDLGQIQMYVNYFDRFERVDGELPTIGIVLCSEKNDAMVRITLPEDNEQIHAARYQHVLPTEEELRQELERERRDAERLLENRDDHG